MRHADHIMGEMKLRAITTRAHFQPLGLLKHTFKPLDPIKIPENSVLDSLYLLQLSLRITWQHCLLLERVTETTCGTLM